MYEKVLIATDGSETASTAVTYGADLAKALGAGVLLLYVGEEEKGNKVLSETAEGLKGLKVEQKVVGGEPADRIIGVAEESGVDLIVVGNKGMTGASRFLLGSVPNAVSHHAPCDVYIVKTT
jgi:nucleotide-binding universal stress UspA family protein